jgi:hypothetical protein
MSEGVSRQTSRAELVFMIDNRRRLLYGTDTPQSNNQGEGGQRMAMMLSLYLVTWTVRSHW